MNYLPTKCTEPCESNGALDVCSRIPDFTRENLRGRLLHATSVLAFSRREIRLIHCNLICWVPPFRASRCEIIDAIRLVIG